jgi:hypothetical protein
MYPYPRPSKHQKLVEEVYEAIQCSRRGEPHPRLYNYMQAGLEERERRANERRQIVKGGLMPPTVERTQPADIPMTFDQDHRGVGGAVKSD